MVSITLRRPYTFIFMAMLIVLATPFVLLKMSTDIFPEVNIPVISIICASVQAQSAVDAARQVRTMAAYCYEGGASTFLDVITAQQSLLAAEHQFAQVQGQRLQTAVFLVKALGGDWCAAPGWVRKANPAP